MRTVTVAKPIPGHATYDEVVTKPATRHGGLGGL